MQTGKIDVGRAYIGESSVTTEVLRAQKTTEHAPKVKEIYTKTREDFHEALKAPKRGNPALERIIERFNELTEAFNIQLRFTIRKEGPNHISVKVINTKTNEVIREIPPEKFSAVGSEFLNAIGFVVDRMA